MFKMLIDGLAVDGDADGRLEDVSATLDVMRYLIAVFLGREARNCEFAAINLQPRNVHGFRRCGICDLNDLLKVFVRLRFSRARVLVLHSDIAAARVPSGERPC